MFDKLRKKIEDRDLQIAIKNNESVMNKTIYFTTETIKDKTWGNMKYIVFYTELNYIQPLLSEEQFKKCKEIGKGSISFFSERNDKTQQMVNKYALKKLSVAHKFPNGKINIKLLIDNGLAYPA